MFELINSDSEKPLKRLGIISLVVYLATAVSLMPWTYYILEMLGSLSLVGIVLMSLFVLGGYGLFKQWRGAKVWPLSGPAVTMVIFLFSVTGVLMETNGNQSEEDHLV